MKRGAPLPSLVLWCLFVVWLLLQLPTFVRPAKQGEQPIDFLAYRRAADAIQNGKSPFLAPEEARRIWRSFHDLETQLLQAKSPDEKQKVLRELSRRPQQPGPYVYPPTLALLIAHLHINSLGFAALTLLSILGFAQLWLRCSGASPLWLLLIISSWDVLASLRGGNVELILLFTTVLAAWSLWQERGLVAAPLIAFTILIKPFYALFFIALGLLRLRNDPETARMSRKTLALAASVTLAIIVFECYRWGVILRGASFHYLRHALEYQWFVLPAPEQTPMSAWNRTPMQALISAGVTASVSQGIALVLWLVLLGMTVRVARGRHLSFPLAYALAFVLLYWGRPVGWGLIYLDVVVVSTVWPTLRQGARAGVLTLAIILMGSHWWALVLAARGEGLPLFTLQHADWPWETWLVLPISWLLILHAVGKTGGAKEDFVPAQNEV